MTMMMTITESHWKEAWSVTSEIVSEEF